VDVAVGRVGSSAMVAEGGQDVIGTEFWEGGMKRQSWRDDHGPDFFYYLNNFTETHLRTVAHTLFDPHLEVA
jgi:hypothetical protein